MAQGNDRHTVHLRGRFTINDQPVTCPNCRADRGLTYYARPVNAEALVSCACGYDWWDKRISGEAVQDLFLALNGEPTRTTSVRVDDELMPRERCPECVALEAETKEFGVLVSAADGAEKAELQARLAASLGAWCGHIADAHLGAAAGGESR